MRYKEKLLILLVLTAGTLTAQQPTVEQVKVTPVLSKALPEIPGKEVVMITVEYAPGGSDRNRASTPSLARDWPKR